MSNVKIKNGCRWFYGRIGSKDKNLGVEIKGIPPKEFGTKGDEAYEKSKREAEIVLYNEKQKVRQRKTEEELAKAVYTAQIGEELKDHKIEDLFDLWLHKPRKRGTTTRERRVRCKNVIGRFCQFIKNKYPAVTSVHHVTPEIAQEFLDIEKGHGVSERSYNDILFIMKCAFGEANANAFKKKIPLEENPVHRIPFTEDEIIEIRKASQSDDFIRPIIITAICTGMRLGDCCQLRWGDVDQDQGIIRVKTSKTGKLICVPIFEWLDDELQNYNKTSDSDFIFKEQERKYRSNPKYLTTRLRKILNMVGFGDSPTHFKVSIDKVDISTLNERVGQYIDTQADKNKAFKMRVLFDEYISGKNIEESCKCTQIARSTASKYLNELEKVTGLPFIRGKNRSVDIKHPGGLKAITQQRTTGLNRASIRGFHAFRSTWVTLALQNGVAVEMVRLVTGHTTTQIVLDNYFNPSTGVMKDTLRNAMPFSDSCKEVA